MSSQKQVIENFLLASTSGDKKQGKKLKEVPSEVQEAVNNLERSLTKDDPLLDSNTFNKNLEKNLKNHSKTFKENKNLTNDDDNEDNISVKKSNEEMVENKHSKKSNYLSESQTKRPVPIPVPRNDVTSRPVPTPRKDVTSGSLINKENEHLIEEEQKKITKRRRKKKTVKRELPEPTIDETNSETHVDTEQADKEQITATASTNFQPNEYVDDGKILGVNIHQSDHLRADIFHVLHPLVKVIMVDHVTGQLLTKSDTSRRVTSFYEEDSLANILPLMTQPYDFRNNKSLLPRWEELIIFNEPFNRFMMDKTIQPILFFIIRDFVTMAKVNNKRSTDGDKGWYNIAWAFLKLTSEDRRQNTKRKLRLQLYYPPRRTTPVLNGNKDPVYDWWLNYPRNKYPSTLYITVKPILPPQASDPTLRSMYISQPEKGVHSIFDLQGEKNMKNEIDTDAVFSWSRFPGQNCKIPNVSNLRLWAGNGGAFRMKFSHKGDLFAIACKHDISYPIVLYSIPSGSHVGILTGHQQLTYDMNWSNNDKLLLSASGDGTVQIWDIKLKDKPVYTLPHPTYVYCAAFHPIAQHVVATGGFDSILRVWSISASEAHLKLELEGHKNALINSLVYDKTGLNLYTADSNGTIISWNSETSPKHIRKKQLHWSIQSKISDPSLSGIFINSLCLHPGNNKILLQCRDSTIRVLDTRIHTLKNYVGATNQRQLIKSCVTPCGNFVFGGSEDGNVYVWNANTQDQVAMYNNLGFSNTVHNVEYHPHDHMVAFCSFSEYLSVLIYKFDKKIATMEATFNTDKTTANVETQDYTDDQNVGVQKTVGSYKFDKVLRALQEVDMDNNPSNLPPVHNNTSSPLLSTWGSTFDTSSPRTNYSKFTSVGNSPYKIPQFFNQKPEVSFVIDESGNESILANAKSNLKKSIKVLVLFDYQANRSDELSILRGEVLEVLLKDSDNWWFGRRINDGSQGYFPCAYVEEQSSSVNDQDILFGTIPSEKSKKVHALKMPGGRLQFYSQSESEGDDLGSISSSRQRRRENKLKVVNKSILKKPKIVVQSPSTENIEPEVLPSVVSIEESSFSHRVDNDTEKTPIKQKTFIKKSFAKEKPFQKKEIKIKIQQPPDELNKTEDAVKKVRKLPDARKLTEINKTASSTSVPSDERFSFLKSVQSLLDKDLFSETVVDGHNLAQSSGIPMKELSHSTDK